MGAGDENDREIDEYTRKKLLEPEPGPGPGPEAPRSRYRYREARRAGGGGARRPGSPGSPAAEMGQVGAGARGPPDMAALRLGQVRQQARAFAQERDWGQYHTPRNLLLALMGELGELSEIFQWKGEVAPGCPDFSAREREHLGEELADVLVYLVRLADVCAVDLSAVVEGRVGSEDLAEDAAAAERRAPRDELFALVAEVGKLSELFQREGVGRARDSTEGVALQDPGLLGGGLADVAVCLARLGESCGADLGAAVQDKLRKNAEKYPAALCRGSSAKYTAYTA